MGAYASTIILGNLNYTHLEKSYLLKGIEYILKAIFKLTIAGAAI